MKILSASPALQPIPTNIITGFLGAGKTTAILSLLSRRPEGETWAVLVNEFGEVGIDGSLLAATESEQGGVFIREVPGGCMCCTSGLPMQVALNQLIARARPDRLLIEPTGLGHPREILETLSATHYHQVLELQATLTLVDARNLRDSRYTEHDIFNQQLQVADMIVASKTDLYGDDDLQRLKSYLATLGLGDTPLTAVSSGDLDPTWLIAPRRKPALASLAVQQPSGAGMLQPLPVSRELPASGYQRFDSAGEGLVSSGWLFDASFVFDYQRLYSLLLGVEAMRLKAIFITDQGVMGFNRVDDVLTSMSLGDTADSRVEVIGNDRDAWLQLEQDLLDCRLE
ncbi:MAG: CobW family GTP-binding protein [Porticoccaceae bacterium]|nr:CobW family GTP-binding protein [Porticoccaceae bacterium]